MPVYCRTAHCEDTEEKYAMPSELIAAAESSEWLSHPEATTEL